MLYSIKFGPLVEVYTNDQVVRYLGTSYFIGVKIKNRKHEYFKHINHLPVGTLVLWKKDKQHWIEFK